MSSRFHRDLLYHLLAPAFLILTPFISYITYNRYSYAAPEIWVCLAGLTAIGLLFGLIAMVGGWPTRVVLTAGLLVLFVDVQFDGFNPSSPWPEFRVIVVFSLALLLAWAMRRHLSRIVTAVFATMLVMTVVLGDVQDVGTPGPIAAAVNDPKPQSRPAPIFVHLVLDEYIGIEGIPSGVPHGKEMRTFLRDFFENYGFRLFGRAYSRYASTYNSLPNIVNFSSESVDGALTSGTRPYALTKNDYFKTLYEAGYRIHVYQSDYMDFCGVVIEFLVRCYNNPITGIKAIEELNVTLWEKVDLISNVYARLSTLQKVIGGNYKRLRERLRSSGWILPKWWFKDARLGPVPSMPLFDRITADVASSSSGDMFFVYFSVPHFPYVYDSVCNVYHSANWERPVNQNSPKLNDRQSRARRYGRYLEQVGCLHRKLDTMFQAWQKVGIFDRLMIVMHGDHGSKISEHRPVAENEKQLSHADYVDTFSTLFAVKKPGVPAGYDRRIAAVQELLGEVVGRQAEDDRTPTAPIPYVFLVGNPGKPMLRQPLPAFGDGR